MQLPMTFIAVRPMSISVSTPRMSRMAVVGNVECRGRGQKNHQRGARNPGHAFAGQHQREQHDDLFAQGEVDARGLRGEQAAIERYTLPPVMLKLYPMGMTKETIQRGTPNSSMRSMASGSAASELVVANPSAAGSRDGCSKSAKRNPRDQQAGHNRATAQTRSARRSR